LKIEYLDTSEDGLLWMTRYYARVFSAGRKNGRAQFAKATQQLLENPLVGRKFDGLENIRECKITRTPFSIIYTVVGDVIYVIDVRDQRGLRMVAGLERFE